MHQQFLPQSGNGFCAQECWEKLHIIHCGVNPADFRAVSADPHVGDGARLLFVGRLAGVKGLPILLDALARLKQGWPGIKLMVAGDGPDREKLKAESQRLGIGDCVEFLGYQSQRQVRELLGRTNVFVMASFAEGVPVVLMEAMAAQVPVVATQIAGIPELVEDGVSGFLVPPGDPIALADKVDRLLRDGKLRSEFGLAGSEKVSRDFNVLTEAEKLCQILTTAIAGPPAAAFAGVARAPSDQPPRALGLA